MSLLLRIAFCKFEFLKSPSFAKIHILSILFLATRRDPRKFPASTAVPVLAFPSSYLKVPNVLTMTAFVYIYFAFTSLVIVVELCTLLRYEVIVLKYR